MDERGIILKGVKEFFTAKELFCDHVIIRYGGNPWFLMNTRWLHTALVIRRDILRLPVVVNKYSSPSAMYTQRGGRCNLCQIVRDETASGRCYVSAHVQHMAIDGTVLGMTAEDARRLIYDKQGLLPYPVRLEQDVSWLHVDGYDPDNGMKVNFFRG